MKGESPSEPLERPLSTGGSVWFSRARLLLDGTLPPSFDGFVGAQLTAMFRPLEVEVLWGPSLLVAGDHVHPCECRRFARPETVEVGGWLALRTKNVLDANLPFRFLLRGHAGERHDPGNPILTIRADVLVGVPEGYRAHTFEEEPNDRTP
jgi:hypothetical protein